MYRRARQLSKKLARMTSWPSDLTAVKDLPIVQRFRDAIQFDAGPALSLLEHAHPAVRVAALAALEYRQHWRTGQPNEVLRVLETDRVPEVRLAAVRRSGLYPIAGRPRCLPNPSPTRTRACARPSPRFSSPAVIGG